MNMAAMTAAQQKQMPKDALVISSILKELGINEYEPRVINQLLEFTYSEYLFYFSKYYSIAFLEYKFFQA